MRIPTPITLARGLLVLAAATALAGCVPDDGLHAQTPADARARAAYRNKLDTGNWLSPTDAATMIRETPDLQVVFVGNVEDYRTGHLPDSMLVPVMALRMTIEGQKRIAIYGKINRGRSLSKDKPMLIHCWWNACKCPTVPTYSELARVILREKGFRKVHSVEGGMRSWIAGRLPYEKGDPAPSGTKPTTVPAKRRR